MYSEDAWRAFLNQKYVDVDAMSDKDIDAIFKILNDKMIPFYRFVITYNEYMNTKHSYSCSEPLTTLEAHLLTDICDYPNSTVTSLAAAWNRSVSATSQTIRKLIQKKLITRENAKEDAKKFYLHPTPKGVELSNKHKRYDVLDIIKTFKSLKHGLTDEEICCLFKGIRVYEDLLK